MRQIPEPPEPSSQSAGGVESESVSAERRQSRLRRTSAIAGFGKKSERNDSAMMLRFNRTGAKAEAPKRPKLFSTPIASAEMLTNPMYGKMIRFRTVVDSSFSAIESGSEERNDVRRSQDARDDHDRHQRRSRQKESHSRTPRFPFAFSSARYCEKTGMNAALTAPSPTSRRKHVRDSERDRVSIGQVSGAEKN